MTGREHLVLAARLVGMGKGPAKARAEQLLELFGLAGAADRIAARYSGGMRRRLDVAMALVRDPALVFLDEPTTGLDPQSRRALWDLIRETRQRGATVFLTTQYLVEADDLSDRVAIVHGGGIAAVGSPAELKDRFGTTTVHLRVSGAAAEQQVRQVAGVDQLRTGKDGWLLLDVEGGERAVPSLIARLSTAGFPIERLAVVPPTLEDVFLSLTGTELEVGAGGGDDGSLSAVRRGMGVSAGSR